MKSLTYMHLFFYRGELDIKRLFDTISVLEKMVGIIKLWVPNCGVGGVGWSYVGLKKLPLVLTIIDKNEQFLWGLLNQEIPS